MSEQKNRRLTPPAPQKRKELKIMVPKDFAEALFILGIALGIALHRGLMAFVLWTSPDNICAYCEWFGRKKNRHKK